MKCCLIALVGAAMLASSGCGLLPEDLLTAGTPFVVTGTAAIVDLDGGPCRIWEAENGETYHLYQGTALGNDAFDEIIVPGATSRLIIAHRSDLPLDCQFGTIVEVREVLEVR
jgi:hypothetical protein